MKLYKTTYDSARPNINTINVPTDTEVYAVGVKIQKNGETVTHDVDEIKIGTLSTDTYFGDYAIFNLSADSNTASEKYNVTSRNVDIIAEYDYTGIGPMVLGQFTTSRSVPMDIYLSTYIGSKITYNSNAKIYKDGEVYRDMDYVEIYTDGSDTTCTRIVLNGIPTTGGSFPNGKGIYFLNSETRQFEYQAGLEFIAIDEHMVYAKIGTVFDDEVGIEWKGVLTLGKVRLDGDFALQITHSETGEGELADQPVFSQYLTLAGTDASDNEFSYTFPIQE